MKYSILTFGCRTNQADSFDLERQLRARGGEESAVECADLIVVNTCAVTAAAEQAARQAIRRSVRLNPSARILATGCYANRAPDELRALDIPQFDIHLRQELPLLEPHVPRPTSSDERPTTGDQRPTTGDQRPTTVDQRPTTGDQRPTTVDQRPTTNNQQPTTNPMPGPGTRGRTVHLLRVQTGCDERCAYCVVPATRGPSRSVPIARVRDEVAEAAGAGFKELTITGVHLGCYGRDLRPATVLAGLLHALAAHPAAVRFRVSAIEPMDFGEDVVAAVTDGRRFARHFHLPLQHASDRILHAMNRPYTLERYRSVVDNLLRACPDAAIGADLIVGFPGETETDHQACVDYLASSPLAYVHVFPFSPRPGTPAAQMPGRPRGEDVRERVRRLRAIGFELSRRYQAQFVGAAREGLTIEDGTIVLTDNYLRVRIPAGLSRNERVEVQIERDGEPMSGVVVARA